MVPLPSLRNHFSIQSSYPIYFISCISDLEFSEDSQALIWGVAGLEQKERGAKNTEYKSTGFGRFWNKITLIQCLIFLNSEVGTTIIPALLSWEIKKEMHVKGLAQCQLHKNAQIILAMSINFPHHTVLASATGSRKLPFMGITAVIIVNSVCS